MIPLASPSASGFGTANRLVPTILLGRSGVVADLPPGAAEDLHAGIVCALAYCGAGGRGGYGWLDDDARHVVGLIAPGHAPGHAAGGVGGPDGAARAVMDSTAGTAAKMIAATVLSNLAWAAGKLGEGTRWGRHAADLVGEGVPESWRPYPHLALAEKLIDIGDFGEAEVRLKTADGEVLDGERHPAAVDVEICRGRLLYAAGRFRTARRRIGAAVDHATQTGARWTARYGLLQLATTDLRRPDLSAACSAMWRCRAEFADDALTEPSFHYRWGLYLVSTIGLSAQHAADILLEEYADLLENPSLFVTDAAAGPWLVHLAQNADDMLLATHIVAVVETLAAANPGFATVAASAQHARALLAHDAELLSAAAATHRDVWAARLAADHLRSMVGPEGTAGLLPGEPTPTVAPPRPGTDQTVRAEVALTATEHRIAGLVSRGMTNQQIARSLGRSPHTVNYHLRHIFEKLRIRSRVELATYFLTEE